MRTALSFALISAAALTVAGAPALAQGYGDQRMQTERQYNENLRKGGVVEAPPVIEQQSQVITRRTVQLEDQFPMQGTDNPAGNLGFLDYNDEGVGIAWYIAPGLPVTGSEQVGKLEPQEAPPGWRRGP